MKKFLSTIFAVSLSIGFTSPIASAGPTVHVSFVMINPLTNTNVGEGTEIQISQVSRNDTQSSKTDSSGMVSFNIAPESYILDTYCNVCYGNSGTRAGTEYLINPKSDGSVVVLSASDKPVTKDTNGNWIITTTLTRASVAGDPWKRMVLPDLGGAISRIYLLTNANVLTQIRESGNRTSWWLLSPDANGDYSAGSWSKIPSPSPDYNPSAMNGAVLHDGNIMIVGGEFNYNSQGVYEENTNKSYIYDVVNNSWAEVAPPNNGEGYWANIGAPPFAALPDGRVLLSYFGDFGRSTYNQSMVYDPKTGKWTLTGTNKIGRTTEAGYTLLSNDKILTVNTDRGVTSAEIFDPATGSWSPAGNTPQALANSEVGPALMLPSGKVLAEGATGANALYDPKTNSWSSAPNFPTLNNGIQLEAPDNYSAILPNGNSLTSTGAFICSTQNCTIMGPSPFFEYDWRSNTWQPVVDDFIAPSDSAKGTDYMMLPLPNGQVMVTFNGKAEFYSASGSSEPSWSPVIEKVSSNNLSPSSSYQLSGKQLSGLTQGTHFGDEYENATNFPIVQIRNNETHHISYARSFDISTTSIKPDVRSTLSFMLNSKIENGPSTLRVIASGFASLPIDVTISGGVSITKQVMPTPPPGATPTPTLSSTSPTTAESTSAQSPQKTKPLPSKTIVCVKGKQSKKIIGVNPKCPTGYKLKI